MQTSGVFEKLSRHSRWLTPLLIFLAAFSIRLVYLNQISTIPTFEKPIMDEQYHLALAEQINSEEGLPDEPYYRAPLYPYFLAAVFNLTAESVYWTRIIQILLGALSNLADWQGWAFPPPPASVLSNRNRCARIARLL